MVKLFYTTNISVDLAHHEIFRAKIGRGGIMPNRVNHITAYNLRNRNDFEISFS